MRCPALGYFQATWHETKFGFNSQGWLDDTEPKGRRTDVPVHRSQSDRLGSSRLVPVVNSGTLGLEREILYYGAVERMKILQSDDIGRTYAFRPSPIELEAIEEEARLRLGNGAIKHHDPVDIHEYALATAALNAPLLEAHRRRLRELGPEDESQFKARAARVAARLELLGCI